MSPRVLKRIVGQFVPAGKSRVWHNALMDYGAALPSDLKRSVPALTKQSKFDGSFRQLRGNILKNVILSKNLHISVLKTMIRDERIDAALSELSREGFIKIHDEIVTI
jgi:A/G-specific adenine glycosylase